MSISDMFNSMYEVLSMLYHSKLFGVFICLGLFCLPLNIIKRAYVYGEFCDLDRTENKKSWKY